MFLLLQVTPELLLKVTLGLLLKLALFAQFRDTSQSLILKESTPLCTTPCNPTEHVKKAHLSLMHYVLDLVVLLLQLPIGFGNISISVTHTRNDFFGCSIQGLNKVIKYIGSLTCPCTCGIWPLFSVACETAAPWTQLLAAAPIAALPTRCPRSTPGPPRAWGG